MLSDSDYLARKCVYYRGQNDMASKIYLELGAKLSQEDTKKLFAIMREADQKYAEYQHQYIDSIGGNDKLKI